MHDLPGTSCACGGNCLLEEGLLEDRHAGQHHAGRASTVAVTDARGAGNHLLGEQYIRGDVFSLYWGMIFGEPSTYLPRDECDTFHCEAGGQAAGALKLQSSSGGGSISRGSASSQPLSQNDTEKSEARALHGEHREQVREERRLRGSSTSRSRSS